MTGGLKGGNNLDDNNDTDRDSQLLFWSQTQEGPMGSVMSESEHANM